MRAFDVNPLAVPRATRVRDQRSMKEDGKLGGEAQHTNPHGKATTTCGLAPGRGTLRALTFHELELLSPQRVYCN